MKRIGYIETPKSDIRIDEILHHHIHDYDGCDEYAKTYHHFKTSEKVDLKTFETWCYDNLEQRCYCEFDCCGHWFTSGIRVRKLKNRKYAVNISYARNY